MIDLHTHSSVSDGTLSPEELIRTAKKEGLSAVALTDHDTIAGCSVAAVVAQQEGI
ncbi:MAG: PHP domain-containing protein, partial [Treponemataceae bacterium]|nr:PHP domain-containing protein [Treponemataceae bacterium]